MRSSSDVWEGGIECVDGIVAGHETREQRGVVEDTRGAQSRVADRVCGHRERTR